MSGNIHLVLFDCDGTIVDSEASIWRAMADSFDAVRLPPPGRADVRRIVGLSLAEAVKTLLPEGDAGILARLESGYRSAFKKMRTDGAVDEPLFEGMHEVISTLAGMDNVLLGIVTGKSLAGLEITLENHGLRERFLTLQTACRHPSKPNPAMVEAACADLGIDAARTVVIGDTRYDMEMAVNSRTLGLGVLWGYHGRKELTQAGARTLAEKPSDLENLTLDLLGEQA